MRLLGNQFAPWVSKAAEGTKLHTINQGVGELRSALACLKGGLVTGH